MIVQHCLKSCQESEIMIGHGPPPISEGLTTENRRETPEQEPTTPQEPNQQTYKSKTAACQLRMDNMLEEEATAKVLDSAECDRPNRLECNLIENTNVSTALNLVLEVITPTHQAEANVNPLPAPTPW